MYGFVQKYISVTVLRGFVKLGNHHQMREWFTILEADHSLANGGRGRGGGSSRRCRGRCQGS